MDRRILLEHLRQAERHAAGGECVLEHQRSVIEQLRRDGHGERLIDEAEELLRSFEQVQSLYLADVARLHRELGTLT